MDPYFTLGVARGCSRQELKDAFRAKARYAHPDRGGEVLSFVQLRTAYEQILAELEREPGPDREKPEAAPSHEHATTTRSGVAEEPYEVWVRHLAAQASGEESVWRSAPVRMLGVALVLVLITVNLVVCWILWTSNSPLPSAAPPVEPANGADQLDATFAPIRPPSLPKESRRWERPPVNPADFFIIPYNATLYVAPGMGDGGGVTEFGVVESQGDPLPIFTGLPGHLRPAREIEVGHVSAGSKLRIYLKRGNSWAFSDSVFTEQSRETFSDRDNSLGGNGSIIEKTGASTWILHLDDIGSHDDDDDDIFIQIRLERREE
jgi:DnaJ domain